MVSIIEKFEAILLESVQNNNFFNFAVSGGLTPLPFLEQIGKKFRNDSQWRSVASNVNVFWVDERPVPIDHSLSNAGQAIEFFENTGINIFPIKGDAIDLSQEAARYQELISENVKRKNKEGISQFDLILLGMGEDGHIASLFPETGGIKEAIKWITPNYVPKLKHTRITMTFPLLFSSDIIWILFSGEYKRECIQRITMENKDLPVNRLLNNFKNNSVVFIEI